ncbi:3-oxoacyl-[acyl-carrier protein] reductase [Friedmanniella endophytica]|uniref:3-oxoacyl-[acyl-carrier protein] reductase n=1 Tax=Microlunatus kandeliicorticis TaxID=1759536 RepID=A0A7W3IVA4_9ACTN|nr:SDR family oxidoreductase [Microlunatus kandeliicorticis]MBA8795902.1 3-oxoacyl-[acyl-carrier protein] reductase [Microlunatus kandeliicorticis]
MLPTAVVTGASRGLGAHLARHLGAAGHPVCVNYRTDPDGAARVVDDVTGAGGSAIAVQADVTVEADVRRLVATAEERLGPVGVLVANATGPQPTATVAEVTWRQYLDQLEPFVLSPTLLVQAALGSMRGLGGGRVLLIGSDLADRADPGWSAYVAAKKAQVGLVKVWAKELGADRITVNLVQPGWIPVERHAGADVDGYRAEVPLGRMGEPADLAAVVTFLASAAAGFVTGQVLSVNGGHTI